MMFTSLRGLFGLRRIVPCTAFFGLSLVLLMWRSAIRPIWQTSETFRANVAPLHRDNYTRALVIASLKEENTSWVERELRNETNLQKAVYIVNNESSAFHVPLNKGHEVMP
jgi:Protein of unknown function (DUF3431)